MPGGQWWRRWRLQQRLHQDSVLRVLMAGTRPRGADEARAALYVTLAVEEGGPTPMHTVQGLVGCYAGVAGRLGGACSPFVGRAWGKLGRRRSPPLAGLA